MRIDMRRNAYQPNQPCEHAGLLLDRGFETWGDDHPEKVLQLHQAAAAIEYSPLYENAYQRWKKILTGNPGTSKTLEAKLENRLYLGMGEASPLEAGITLHQTYGVPFIPGTAVKGVLHHYARNVGVDQKIQDIIFGREPDSENKRDSGEAGYLIFNNAWWIPGKKALAPEIITVHYKNYYQEKGAKGTDKRLDFESPNPNPQIAIQGSFLFSVEGDEAWANYAIKLMKRALTENGIGGKTSSGYGLFFINQATQLTEEIWENAIIKLEGNKITAKHNNSFAKKICKAPKDALDILGNPTGNPLKKLKKGQARKNITVTKHTSWIEITDIK